MFQPTVNNFYEQIISVTEQAKRNEGSRMVITLKNAIIAAASSGKTECVFNTKTDKMDGNDVIGLAGLVNNGFVVNIYTDNEADNGITIIVNWSNK